MNNEQRDGSPSCDIWELFVAYPIPCIRPTCQNVLQVWEKAAVLATKGHIRV